MLLTKECDYGIRIIRTLADGFKKTVEAICEAEHIPSKYAYKITKKLEHAGLLKSLRGRDGGYLLVKPLDEITLYDIIAAVDSKMFVFECLRDDISCPLNTKDEPCGVHKEFSIIQDILINSLTKNTLQDVFKNV